MEGFYKHTEILTIQGLIVSQQIFTSFWRNRLKLFPALNAEEQKQLIEI